MLNIKLFTLIFIISSLVFGYNKNKSFLNSVEKIKTLDDIKDFSLKPKGIASDSQNNTYITFFNGHIVGKFSSSGDIIGWLGISVRTNSPTSGWEKNVFVSKSNEHGAFFHPHSLRIFNNELYIAEYGNNRIQKFSLNGKYLGTLGVTTSGEFTNGFKKYPSLTNKGTHYGVFKGIAALTFDKQGALYVSDYLSGCIVKFNNKYIYQGWIGKRTDKKFNQSWNKSGIPVKSDEVKGFKGTHGLVVSPNNLLYIADTHNHRVLKYTLNGEFIAWIGLNSKKQTLNKWMIKGKSIATNLTGGFNNPIDIIFDTKKSFIVLEEGNSRIQKFYIDGRSIGWIGAHRDGSISKKWNIKTDPYKSHKKGGFSGPFHADLSENTLKVSDTYNQRIQFIDWHDL